eukprot:2093208-Rhodomonas_salina.1
MEREVRVLTEWSERCDANVVDAIRHVDAGVLSGEECRGGWSREVWDTKELWWVVVFWFGQTCKLVSDVMCTSPASVTRRESKLSTCARPRQHMCASTSSAVGRAQTSAVPNVAAMDRMMPKCVDCLDSSTDGVNGPPGGVDGSRGTSRCAS